jgi:hypothetical protein
LRKPVCKKKKKKMIFFCHELKKGVGGAVVILKSEPAANCWLVWHSPQAGDVIQILSLHFAGAQSLQK